MRSNPSQYSGESLRGYGYEIHKRDNFRWVYCGVDGKASFDARLTLTVDHLLPKGHPYRDDPDYIVTACAFCNVAKNRYFDKAQKLGPTFDARTRAVLVEQRRKFVLDRREAFSAFLESAVKPFAKES